MSDPVSALASVIAIATAAAQIGKAISRLRSFGQIPSRIYALRNEVTDLEVVLRQVGHALQQNEITYDSQEDSLRHILEQGRTHLADLAKALERVANACAGGRVKAISRSSVWLHEKSLFEEFQDNIRKVRDSLNVMLGVSNSRDLQHVILELRRVTFIASNSEQTHEAYSRAVTEALDEHRTSVHSHLDEKYQGLTDRIDALGKLIISEKMRDEAYVRVPPASSKENTKSPDPETLRVLISDRVPCRSWCPCVCHNKRKAKAAIPAIMENVFGKMFVGYTGLPVLGPPCDFRGCKDKQRPAVTMEYWFPWWFVSKYIRMNFKYLPSTGPQLQLSSTRRVPDTAQSIAFAMQGNIDGLKHLFTNGLASPRDVSDSRGFSLMRWALYGGMHQYETVQFLIDQGANVDEISYNNVWDFIFRGKCNNKQIQGLRCITQNGENDWVEEQNFPLVHRIIFGLSGKPLISELDENPNAIYATDAQGRTALDWATARAELDSMNLLLSYGADPNNIDIGGRTAVLHAVDSHSVPCLRLVLQAGGNPNPPTPNGTFRSSPLTAAGFSGIPGLLEALLEFGANPNACNPEGMTALHSVARTKNVECAILLLEFGGDMNLMSSNGRTPLTTAIIHNNHAVAQLFINRYSQCITRSYSRGPQLLPIIAEHADLETIYILAASQPLKLTYDLSVESISSNREILQNRPDYSEELSEAFEELIVIAQAEAIEVGSIDSLVESSLFLSARSSFHSDLADAWTELNSVGSTSPQL